MSKEKLVDYKYTRSDKLYSKHHNIGELGTPQQSPSVKSITFTELGDNFLAIRWTELESRVMYIFQPWK